MRGRKRHRKKRNKPIVAFIERWMQLRQPEIDAAAQEYLEAQLLWGTVGVLVVERHYEDTLPPPRFCD